MGTIPEKLTLAKQMSLAGCRSVSGGSIKYAIPPAVEMGRRRPITRQTENELLLLESILEGKACTAAPSLEHRLRCAHSGLQLQGGPW